MKTRESDNSKSTRQPTFPLAAVVLTVIGILVAIALLSLRPESERWRATLATAAPSAFASPVSETHGYDPAVFANNTKYPAPVTVDLIDTQIAAKADSAYIGVELSGRSANTVVAFVRCTWGNGAGPVKDRTQAVFFRSGDALKTQVSCPMRPGKVGSTVRFVQANVPDGARRGRQTAVAELIDKAVTPARPGIFRASYRFSPRGKMIYQSKGSELKMTDSGSAGSWSTALPHGRTQPANAETGYYGPLAMDGFVINGDDLALTSRRLAKPFQAKDGKFPFLAAILSGHNTANVQFTYGSVEWVAKMPNRKGSWPALWLLPTSGWPPEIDVYEGFTYNNEWNPASSLSSNIHGGANIKRTFDRAAFRLRMEDFGLSPTVTSEFHKFQVTVDPQWITIFVDDVETMRYANGFADTRWFPLMQVGVKIPPDDAYDKGSGAMTLRLIRIWRAE